MSIKLITKNKIMEEPTSSPVPVKEITPVQEEEQKGVDFPSAVAFLKNGEKITRVDWGDENIYGVMKKEMLLLHRSGDKFNSWIISQGDMDANDWVIVKK